MSDRLDGNAILPPLTTISRDLPLLTPTHKQPPGYDTLSDLTKADLYVFMCPPPFISFPIRLLCLTHFPGVCMQSNLYFLDNHKCRTLLRMRLPGCAKHPPAKLLCLGELEGPLVRPDRSAIRHARRGGRCLGAVSAPLEHARRGSSSIINLSRSILCKSEKEVLHIDKPNLRHRTQEQGKVAG
jgi:hypothetical protein